LKSRLHTALQSARWKGSHSMPMSGKFCLWCCPQPGCQCNHQYLAPIYRGSHGKSCLGTACKTWTIYAIRVTLDEPGSQPALTIDSSPIQQIARFRAFREE
jgi:hypothetical protein